MLTAVSFPDSYQNPASFRKGRNLMIEERKERKEVDKKGGKKEGGGMGDFDSLEREREKERERREISWLFKMPFPMSRFTKTILITNETICSFNSISASFCHALKQ